VIRKRIERLVRESNLNDREYFYLPSLSSRTLVYKGLLLPEQREIVNRRATLIGLERRDGPAGPVEDQVRARAHVATLSRRSRRVFVEKTLETLHELTSAVTVEPTVHPPGETDEHVASLDAAIVEASMAVAGGATVIVLTRAEHLNDARAREMAGSLADELARRGLTVILLGHERERAPSRVHPDREPVTVPPGGSVPARGHRSGRMSDD